MTDIRWTASLVEERLVEAADVLKRMPPVKVQGYFSTWPKIVHEFSDLVGQEPPLMCRPFPSAAAISRMEETLSWTVGLDPVDAKITWLRAYGERWKHICWSAGLTRITAHRHWIYALCVIAWRLNNGQKRMPSRTRVLMSVYNGQWRETQRSRSKSVSETLFDDTKTPK
jgi:hypothetical protein